MSSAVIAVGAKVAAGWNISAFLIVDFRQVPGRRRFCLGCGSASITPRPIQPVQGAVGRQEVEKNLDRARLRLR